MPNFLPPGTRENSENRGTYPRASAANRCPGGQRHRGGEKLRACCSRLIEVLDEELVGISMQSLLKSEAQAFFTLYLSHG